MSQGLRRAALALHALPARERRRVLNRLDRDERLRLAPHLAELRRLGWPRAASELGGVTTAPLRRSPADARNPSQPQALAEAWRIGATGTSDIASSKPVRPCMRPDTRPCARPVDEARWHRLAGALQAEPDWLQSDVLACLEPQEAARLSEAWTAARMRTPPEHVARAPGLEAFGPPILDEAMRAAMIRTVPPLRRAWIEQWLHEQAAGSLQPSRPSWLRKLAFNDGVRGHPLLALVGQALAMFWQGCGQAWEWRSRSVLRNPGPRNANRDPRRDAPALQEPLA